MKEKEKRKEHWRLAPSSFLTISGGDTGCWQCERWLLLKGKPLINSRIHNSLPLPVRLVSLRASLRSLTPMNIGWSFQATSGLVQTLRVSASLTQTQDDPVGLWAAPFIFTIRKLWNNPLGRSCISERQHCGLDFPGVLSGWPSGLLTDMVLSVISVQEDDGSRLGSRAFYLLVPYVCLFGAGRVELPMSMYWIKWGDGNTHAWYIFLFRGNMCTDTYKMK